MLMRLIKFNRLNHSFYQYNLAIQDIYFIFLRANKRAETNMQLAIITPHFMTSIPGYTKSMLVIIMIWTKYIRVLIFLSHLNDTLERFNCHSFIKGNKPNAITGTPKATSLWVSKYIIIEPRIINATLITLYCLYLYILKKEPIERYVIAKQRFVIPKYLPLYKYADHNQILLGFSIEP